MNVCSNCYTGCAETTSDKCVRYTGIDIEILGIQNGDSLNYVTSTIVGFLTSTLDGSGIKYELDAENLCSIVSNELIDCTDINVVNITNALSKAICTLDTLVTTNINDITTINGPYTPGCVPSIVGDEGVDVVLQATIDYICTVNTRLEALSLDVSTNYVQITDIDTYIANYIASQSGGGVGQKTKMVPYAVMEYYGPTGYFDATGAGTGDWEEVYLCNGQNFTPDKRGRIAVGTTSGMLGGVFPTATDPAQPGNPTYSLLDTNGSNTVTLTESQIPNHTHTHTLSTTTSLTGEVTYISETFNTATNNTTGVFTKEQGYPTNSTPGSPDTNSTGKLLLDANHTHTLSINPTGGGNSHSNIPPVLACHYIIYIPTV